MSLRTFHLPDTIKRQIRICVDRDSLCLLKDKRKARSCSTVYISCWSPDFCWHLTLGGGGRNVRFACHLQYSSTPDWRRSHTQISLFFLLNGLSPASLFTLGNNTNSRERKKTKRSSDAKTLNPTARWRINKLLFEFEKHVFIFHADRNLVSSILCLAKKRSVSQLTTKTLDIEEKSGVCVFWEEDIGQRCWDHWSKHTQ